MFKNDIIEDLFVESIFFLFFLSEILILYQENITRNSGTQNFSMFKNKNFLRDITCIHNPVFMFETIMILMIMVEILHTRLMIRNFILAGIQNTYLQMVL